MGLYKETAYWFEEYQKQQVRIYEDAYDEGILVESAQDPLCISIARALDDGFLFGGLKKHRKEYRTKSVVSVTIAVYIPWEYDNTNMACSKWEVTYTSDLVRKKKFFSFNHQRVTVKSNKVWDNEN